MGRLFPDAETEFEQAEVKRLLAAVNNNVPGLLQEMHIGKAGQKIARNRLPVGINGGFLRANGPLVSSHMETFSAKIGFALYFELTKRMVPIEGGVATRWFSNYERLQGTFPQTVFDYLLPPNTLRQGIFEVSDQFGYQWRMAEDDRMGMFFAYFRQSFAVIAFVAIDRSLLKANADHPIRIYAPGELRNSKDL
jgi:hypothetical protein